MKPVYYYDRIAYECGMIEAWMHIKVLCNSCIKAHREEIKKLRKLKREHDKGGKE
jgi:uncharacterized membrane protein